MTITIKINTENAAFEGPNKDTEIARLMQKIADRFSEGGSDYAKGNLRDYNGNTVGTVTVRGK